MSERFEKYESEFLKFDRIKHPHHRRPDICAFLMLDEMFPGNGDIIDHAINEEIFLSIVVDNFLAIATDEQIIDLIRCGVRYNENQESLAMYV